MCLVLTQFKSVLAGLLMCALLQHARDLTFSVFHWESKECSLCATPTLGSVQHINSESSHMLIDGLDLEAALTLGQRCKMFVDPISTTAHHWYGLLI